MDILIYRDSPFNKMKVIFATKRHADLAFDTFDTDERCKNMIIYITFLS